MIQSIELSKKFIRFRF